MGQIRSNQEVRLRVTARYPVCEAPRPQHPHRTADRDDAG